MSRARGERWSARRRIAGIVLAAALVHLTRDLRSGGDVTLRIQRGTTSLYLAFPVP